MDPTLISGFVQLLSSGGLLVGFVIVLVTGARSDWIFGATHKQIVARYEAQLLVETERSKKWEGIALEALDKLGKSQEITEEAIKSRRGRSSPS